MQRASPPQPPFDSCESTFLARDEKLGEHGGQMCSFSSGRVAVGRKAGWNKRDGATTGSVGFGTVPCVSEASGLRQSQCSLSCSTFKAH